jgi:predicted DNA-binding protein (MmcQ/YjbR family)
MIMKITPEVYAELKQDVLAIAAHCQFKIRPDTSMTTMWCIVNEINAQRSYDDTHPRWAERKRILPASHVNKQCWLNDRLYQSGLNDEHIKTALKKIAAEQHH